MLTYIISQYLHRIERANRGHEKSAIKILEEVYGRSGRTRHALIHVSFTYVHKKEESH